MTDHDARRATPAELDSWRWRLGGWLEPEDFEGVVDAIRARCGDHGLDQPGSLFKEAFLAHQCAVASGARGVRLGADPPDFELLIGGRIVQCEAVEVLAPGRRRGAELKAERAEQSPPVVALPEDEWVTGESALEAVRIQLNKKAAKAYAPGTILVAYLNVGFIRGEQAFASGLPAVAQTVLGVFQEVWLLRKGDRLVVA